MSVKLTLEFDNIEQAIVALGKLAGIRTKGAKVTEPAAPVQPQAPTAPASVASPTPVAAEPEKRTRKPRADAGKPREPYGPRTTSEPGQPSTPQAALAPATPAEGSPAAPTPAAPAQTVQSAPAQSTAPAAAGPVPKLEDVQKAVEALYNKHDYDVTSALLSRFGTKRWSLLLENQRANFIKRAEELTALPVGKAMEAV